MDGKHEVEGGSLLPLGEHLMPAQISAVALHQTDLRRSDELEASIGRRKVHSSVGERPDRHR